MNRKIILFANDSRYVANLRRELIERIVAEGYELTVCTPESDDDFLIKELGCKKVSINYDAHSMNPFQDMNLLRTYYKFIKKVKPICVITFTIKPNIYVSIVCRIFKINCMSNITGLGPVFEKNGIIKKLVLLMYRVSMKRKGVIFFQNKSDMNYLLNNKIGINKNILIPGSGVNINRFTSIPYPSNATIEFVFISRLIKEKGIDQYLDVAKYIMAKYNNVYFHICGGMTKEYKSIIDEFTKNNTIIYHGLISDVREILKKTHCTIHPTYYPEGMSNVLLESCACARPIITTDRSGCREIVDDGVNGFIVEEKNSDDLINKVEEFINLNYESKKNMGLNARHKVVREFNREIVVDKYMENIYGK